MNKKQLKNQLRVCFSGAKKMYKNLYVKAGIIFDDRKERKTYCKSRMIIRWEWDYAKYPTIQWE